MICFYYDKLDLFLLSQKIILNLSKHNKLLIIFDFYISDQNILKNLISNNIKIIFPNLTNIDENKKNRFIIFFLFFKKFFNDKIYAKKIVKKFKIKKLCLCSDREVGLGSSLIKLSKKYDYKIVLINVFSSNTSGSITNRKYSPKNYSSLTSLKKFFYKKDHKIIYRNKIYYFFKFEKYLAAYLNNILVKNPWDRGFESDYIFTESKISFNQLTNINKINKDKIFISGLPIFDYLRSGKIQKKNIILHMPHLYEHGFFNYYQTIKSYDQLLNKFAQLKLNQKIIIIFHPRISNKIKNLVKLKFKNFFYFSTKPLVDEIKQASIYITWWSTTMAWAHFLKIPIIALNCFGSAENGWEEYKNNSYVINRYNQINKLLIEKVLKVNNLFGAFNKNFNFSKKISKKILEI
jgi:hypothetical protein